jgi:uncharacterized membrane protein YbhN (UPF0104 family)
MKARLRQWWPVCKWLLTLAILIVVGRRFYQDLARPELWQRSLQPLWLLLAGALYLIGLGFSALYWRRLLGHLGESPSLRATLRAYYVGHLGKYLPGKAWALILRSTLVHGEGTRLGLAALTSFYEVLTTMASGVLLALILFACLASGPRFVLDVDGLVSLLRLEVADDQVGIQHSLAVVLSLLLTLLFLGVLAPPVFNRLVHHLSLPFRDREQALPQVRWSYLGEGLALTALGWLWLGGSLACTLQGIAGPEIAWTPTLLGRLPALLGLSYVVGFVIVVAPSGLGVREFFLTLLLVPELLASPGLALEEARGVVVLTVLVLRLVWTLAELLLAGVLYLLPSRRVELGEPVAAAP